MEKTWCTYFKCKWNLDQDWGQDNLCSAVLQTGGYGTLEELLEVITWAQLGIHDKPVNYVSAFLGPWCWFLPLVSKKLLCLFSLIVDTVYLIKKSWFILQVGLLNVDGYYNSLLSFIDKAVEEGFISPSARQIIVSAPTAMELMKKLEVV